MATKVILADDHQLMREGLRTLIENELAMEVVGDTGDGKVVVQLARELSPDVILMDVEMPGLDGIEATRRIINENPEIKVIALSMHSNKLFISDMFKAGASGYLLKECASWELASATETVLSDELYLSPKVTHVVLDDYFKPSSLEGSLTVILTERECEVLRLLASGKSTKQIALEAGKSVQGIDAHRRQIMHKLGIDSLAELIKYAIREGLTSL